MSFLNALDRRGAGADSRRELLLAQPEPRTFLGDQAAVDAATLGHSLQGRTESASPGGRLGRLWAVRRPASGLALHGFPPLRLTHFETPVRSQSRGSPDTHNFRNSAAFGQKFVSLSVDQVGTSRPRLHSAQSIGVMAPAAASWNARPACGS